jgi:hypothetical protein
VTNPMHGAIEAFNQMSVMADAVVGYRQKLVDGGVPPSVADTMATEYHSVLLEMMRTQATGKTGVRR